MERGSEIQVFRRFESVAPSKYTTVMKYLLFLSFLFFNRAKAQMPAYTADTVHGFETITPESMGVDGEYKLLSATYIKHGVYRLLLRGVKYNLVLPKYLSHSWKKKTRFSKYYSVTNTKYGVKIMPL